MNRFSRRFATLGLVPSQPPPPIRIELRTDRPVDGRLCQSLEIRGGSRCVYSDYSRRAGNLDRLDLPWNPTRLEQLELGGRFTD